MHNRRQSKPPDVGGFLLRITVGYDARMTIIPPKLARGSGIRIIAPSCTLPSMPWVDDDHLERCKKFFTDLGMTVTEGKYLREMAELQTTSIEHRVADIHDAFRDPSVHALIAIRGGWNSNQLLRHLDYDLIRAHPKIFCGFSDITAPANAIYAKTGLMTYSGPNFSQFGTGEQVRYTYDSFLACFTTDVPYTIEASKRWSDDFFSPEHTELEFERNDGPWIFAKGEAEGTIAGGNLCTFNLLQGTEFMPPIKDTILFLEDDHESLPRAFDRDLQSLLHLPHSDTIRGLVIGRFQKASGMTRELLEHIVRTKAELPKGIPIIANVDTGHTKPMATFPIGGTARISMTSNKSTIEILCH